MNKTVKSIGEPKSWQGPNGVVWYFPIDFTDGSTGQFSTKNNPQKKFEVNKEFAVKQAGTDKNGVIKWDIDKPAYVPGQSQPQQGGYHKSPEEQYRITKEVTAEAVIQTIIDSQGDHELKTQMMVDDHRDFEGKDDSMAASNALRREVQPIIDSQGDHELKTQMMVDYLQYFEGKDDSMAASNALRRAVQEIPYMAYVSYFDLLKQAEWWYKVFMNPKPQPKS